MNSQNWVPDHLTSKAQALLSALYPSSHFLFIPPLIVPSSPQWLSHPTSHSCMQMIDMSE
jgi:hypothetical protein